MLIYVKGRYPQVVHIGEADVVDKLGIVSEMMFEIFLIFHSAMVISQIILVIYLCRDICFSHIPTGGYTPKVLIFTVFRRKHHTFLIVNQFLSYAK